MSVNEPLSPRLVVQNGPRSPTSNASPGRKRRSPFAYLAGIHLLALFPLSYLYLQGYSIEAVPKQSPGFEADLAAPLKHLGMGAAVEDTGRSLVHMIEREESEKLSESCKALTSPVRFHMPYVNLTAGRLPGVYVPFGEVAAEQISIASWMWLERWPYKGYEWCILSHGSWMERFKFSIRDNGLLQLTIVLQESTKAFDLSTYSSHVLLPRQWYHVAAIFDSRDGRISMFINGLEAIRSPRSVSGQLKMPLRTTRLALTVGRCTVDDINPNSMFRGLAGGATVWPWALRQCEVRSLMYKNVAPDCDPSPSFDNRAAFDAEAQSWPLAGVLEKVPRLSTGSLMYEPAFLPAVEETVEVVVPVPSRSQKAVRRLIASILCESVFSVEAKQIVVRLVALEPNALSDTRGGCYQVRDSRSRHGRVTVHVYELPAKTTWSDAMNEIVNSVTHPRFILVEPHIQVTSGWIRGLWRQIYASPPGRHAWVSRVLYSSGRIRTAGMEFHMAPSLRSDYPFPFDRFRGFPHQYRSSLEHHPVMSFGHFCTVLDTAAARQVKFDASMEPRFSMVDFALHLHFDRHYPRNLPSHFPNNSTPAHLLTLQSSPRPAESTTSRPSARVALEMVGQHVYDSVVFVDNSADLLLEDEVADFMRGDPDLRAFTTKWSRILRREIASKYSSRLRARFIGECAGVAGVQHAFVMRELETTVALRTLLGHYRMCEINEPIGKLPAAYQDVIHRLRLRSFSSHASDQVIIYGRDVRELPRWVDMDTPAYLVGRVQGHVTRAAAQVYKSFNELWVLSEYHADRLIKLGIPKIKIHKVPEAVDENMYDERLMEPMPFPERRGIVFAAILDISERSGWKELIAAYMHEFTHKDRVSLYLHARLVNVTGDPLDASRIMQTILKFAHKHGLYLFEDRIPHISIIGRFMTPWEIMRMVRGCDIFIDLSPPDTWNSRLQESMALGKATIGLKGGTNQDMMNDNVAYLVDSEAVHKPGQQVQSRPSVVHMRDVLRHIYEHQMEAREKGYRAREWVRSKFSAAAVHALIRSHMERIERTVRLPVVRKSRVMDDEQTLAIGYPRADIDIECLSSLENRFHIEGALVDFAERPEVGIPVFQKPQHAALPSAASPSTAAPFGLRSLLNSRTNAVPGAAAGGNHNIVAPGRTSPLRVALISTFPPRMCGIGMFSADLIDHLYHTTTRDKLLIEVLPMVLDDNNDAYDPQLVKAVIRRNHVVDYQRAAAYINKNFDVLVIQHEFGIFGGPAGSHVICLLRNMKIATVTTLHTVKEDLPNAEMRSLQSIIKLSDRVVVMNEISVRYLDAFHAVSTTKLVVIPHGVPSVDRVDSDAVKFNWGLSRKLVMLSFGFIGPGKGLEYVLEAMPTILRDVKNFVLVIAGVSTSACGQECQDYLAMLKHLAARYKLGQHVIFLQRYFTHEEKVMLIQAADIFITPYPDPSVSSSGTASLAMAAGRVVISTPFTSSRDLLREERGVLVRFKDSNSIASAVIDLAQDPAKRVRIANNAYKAASEMQWSDAAQMYWDLLNTFPSNTNTNQHPS